MDQRSRRYRPRIEGLEGRDLPSGASPSLEMIAAARESSTASAQVSASSSIPSWVDLNYLHSLVNTLYGPVTTTMPVTIGGQTFPAGTYNVPQPTAHEFRREIFWVQFVGHYSVGAPRFSNQASTVHIYSNGRSATSNQFLNGRAQMILFPPADPTASPTTEDPVAGQVVGLFSAFTSNVLQSGDNLEAEITNLPGTASNDPATLQNGLPAHLQFLIDPGGVSGGLYSTPAYQTTPATIENADTGQSIAATGGSGGAVAFNQGAGKVDILYIPTNRLRSGASQSGTVIVRMQGLINTTGTLNPLYAGIN
jgi:hypothetical protein